MIHSHLNCILLSILIIIFVINCHCCVCDQSCNGSYMFLNILLHFLQGNDLIVGNIGDSRAVLGTRVDDNSMIALQLTVDLIPNVPSRQMDTLN